MRFRFIPLLLTMAICSLSLFSCNEKEEFTTDQLSDYLPLQKGKYITYRLDSTVFTSFGTVTEVHSYQFKHVVDTMMLDGTGRPSYRVFVYQRDVAGTQPWQPVNSSTYFVIPYSDRIEVVDENNFRILKMHAPLRDGYSWKGNSYLPPNPYGSKFNFSNDDNMADWDFYYDGGPADFSVNGMNYADVYSVEEADESYNVPITDVNAYAARTRAVEKYAKGIGLVYKELEMWEYQPNPGGASPYKTGFGLKMWMTDHN